MRLLLPVRAHLLLVTHTAIGLVLLSSIAGARHAKLLLEHKLLLLGLGHLLLLLSLLLVASRLVLLLNECSLLLLLLQCLRDLLGLLELGLVVRLTAPHRLLSVLLKHLGHFLALSTLLI